MIRADVFKGLAGESQRLGREEGSVLILLLSAMRMAEPDRDETVACLPAEVRAAVRHDLVGIALVHSFDVAVRGCNRVSAGTVRREYHVRAACPREGHRLAVDGGGVLGARPDPAAGNAGIQRRGRARRMAGV